MKKKKKRVKRENIHVTRLQIGKGRHDDTSAQKLVLGIDPGLAGAFVLFDGENFASFSMPVKVNGKQKEVVFDWVHELLTGIGDGFGRPDVFLERAVSFGMGTKGAFNYGRGFAAIEIALQLLQWSVTYVEPSAWSKEMHAGISKDLKPKAKSLVALERLYPRLAKQLPKAKNGKLEEGAVDAFLIAAYGHRKLGGASPKSSTVEKVDMPDFY